MRAHHSISKDHGEGELNEILREQVSIPVLRYLAGLMVRRTVNGSTSRVMPTKPMHISSVVCSPQPTAIGGLLGFLGLSEVLSNVQVTFTVEYIGITIGSL